MLMLILTCTIIFLYQVYKNNDIITTLKKNVCLAEDCKAKNRAKLILNVCNFFRFILQCLYVCYKNVCAQVCNLICKIQNNG
jgi:hypothetical protein